MELTDGCAGRLGSGVLSIGAAGQAGAAAQFVAVVALVRHGRVAAERTALRREEAVRDAGRRLALELYKKMAQVHLCLL